MLEGYVDLQVQVLCTSACIRPTLEKQELKVPTKFPTQGTVELV